MSLASSTDSTRNGLATATMPASLDTPTADERWEPWQARCAAHDRAVRRKLAIAAPIVGAVAAALLFALAVR